MEERKMAQPFINYAPETCAYCGGKGWAGVSHATCPACGGQGSVLVAQPARKCAFCGGKGWTGVRHHLYPACGGTGWAHALRHEE